MSVTKSFLILLLITIFNKTEFVKAQTEMPFRGNETSLLKDTLEDDDKSTTYLWRENDSIWAINITKSDPLIYRLLNMKDQILVEGTLANYLDNEERFVKHGKWVELYANGNLKSEGYYNFNEPVGYWQYYHPNGKIRKTYQYQVVTYEFESYNLLLGAVEEFYSNGQLKMMGKYKMEIITQQKETIDPITNEINRITISKPQSVKSGTWLFFKLNGEIFKEEKY